MYYFTKIFALTAVIGGVACLINLIFGVADNPAFFALLPEALHTDLTIKISLFVMMLLQFFCAWVLNNEAKTCKKNK